MGKGQKDTGGTSFPGGPVVRTAPSNAGGAGSISGWGAKIPRASQPKDQSIKQKQYCNKFNKDFKNGLHQKKSKKNHKGHRRHLKGLPDVGQLQDRNK